MDRLEQDQLDAKALLDGDALFAPVTILAEDKGDIEADVLQQLATLNTKAGKLGLIGVVLEPEEVPTDPDTPNPELRVRLTVQFIEEQLLNNDASTGTLVNVFAAARRCRQLLHRRSFGGGGVWYWVATSNSPQDSASRRSRLVAFERRDQEERGTRLGAPLIDPEEGGAVPQLVTLTPPIGATARYTLDGTYPGPAATAYSAPFNILSACTLRVVAYQTGAEPSSVAEAVFTAP